MHKIKMNKSFLKGKKEDPLFQKSPQCRMSQSISGGPWDELDGFELWDLQGLWFTISDLQTSTIAYKDTDTSLLLLQSSCSILDLGETIGCESSLSPPADPLPKPSCGYANVTYWGPLPSFLFSFCHSVDVGCLDTFWKPFPNHPAPFIFCWAEAEWQPIQMLNCVISNLIYEVGRIQIRMTDSKEIWENTSPLRNWSSREQ